MLQKGNGTLQLSAKISSMVDECPFNGNLLSGVAKASCLVRKHIPITLTTTAAPDQSTTPGHAEALLQCKEHGCEAKAVLKMNASSVKGQSCKLTVKINQTDFDKDHGSPEWVEWIKLNGTQVKAKCEPGQNPCKTQNLDEDYVKRPEAFTCVSDQAVDVQALSGVVEVTAKLSQKVDECASQGFLLDGLAVVDCK
jgi:hypothetical protein